MAPRYDDADSAGYSGLFTPGQEPHTHVTATSAGCVKAFSSENKKAFVEVFESIMMYEVL